MQQSIVCLKLIIKSFHLLIMASNNPQSTLEGSSTLFSKKDHQNQEDIWDDTALIRAYEKSVKAIKKKLGSTQIKTESTATKSQQAHESSESEEDNVEEEAANEDVTYSAQGRNWKILDLCMAVYSEDGLLYPAKIQSIFESKEGDKKCIIQYLHYLNEEEKYLRELMEYSEDLEAEYDSEPLEPTHKTPNKISLTELKGPAVDFMPKGFSIPPPPPPPLLGEASTDDMDALYSMLLSWYMSGYHTGYYFAKKQINNK